MEKLILKRASANRPSGEWNDDDYDVLNDDKVVDRPQVFIDRRRMQLIWDQGNEATRS